MKLPEELSSCEVLEMIARREFTEFSSIDYKTWKNVKSPNPLISYGDDDNDIIIIIDGGSVMITTSIPEDDKTEFIFET